MRMPQRTIIKRTRSALVGLIPGTAARRKAIADLAERTSELAACRAELAARDQQSSASDCGLAEARAENAALAEQLREAKAQRATANQTVGALQGANAERIRLLRDPSLRQPVLDFLALLAPYRIDGIDLIRVGRESDGGYVMLDDFAGIAGALSCGIADETSWDMAMAERGLPVVQVDDSIEGPRDSHPLWTFHRRRVSATASEPNAITLPELIALCPGSGDSLLAKIDIEGSEWTTLPAAGESLSRCRQLVIEFHDFDRLADPAWRATAMAVLQTVVATHWPIHVHGNNFEPLVVLGGVPVPRVCEVTFALRSRYRMTPAPGLVPSPIDFPNNAASADLHFATRYPTG